jgi:hypothetical protein
MNIKIGGKNHPITQLKEGGILYYKMMMRKYLLHKSLNYSLDGIDEYYILKAFNSLYSVKLLVKLMGSSSTAKLVNKDNKQDVLKQLIELIDNPTMSTIKDIIYARREERTKNESQ